MVLAGEITAFGYRGGLVNVIVDGIYSFRINVGSASRVCFGVGQNYRLKR